MIAPQGDRDAEKIMARFNESLSKILSSGIEQKLLHLYQIQPEVPFTVRLIGPSNFPLAIGTIEEDARRGFLIPRGTSAVVVQWNDLFWVEGDFDAHKDIYKKSRVKILEGPLKDRLLWVPNMFLSFE